MSGIYLNQVLGATLICISGLLAVIHLIFGLIANKQHIFDKKIFGVLIILGLAIFVNNLAIYILTILICGTLVTQQKFLERISALVLKDKTYFPAQQMSKASNEDRRKKAKQEVSIIESVYQPLTLNL